MLGASGALAVFSLPSAFAFLVMLCTSMAIVEGAAPTVVKLRNESGLKVQISWVFPLDRKTVTLAELKLGQAYTINTFEGHEFEIREIPFENSGVCESSADLTCKISYIQVTEPPEQHFIIRTGLEISTNDAAEKENYELLEPPQVLDKCRSDAMKRLAFANNDSEKTMILEKFNECLSKGLVPKLKLANDEVAFEKTIREDISYQSENFTCTNADTEASPDVDQREWTSVKDGVTRIVHVKLDRPASRIHVVENFANPDECDAMEKAALGSGRLERAVTQDGEGGVRVSEHRKAMQVDIEPDWSKEGEGDRIARLSRRIYDYTNHVLGTNISEQGQEPLMSIQYFGRGYHDSNPDRYMPHCDGKCIGQPHKYGSRMATMVIYCTIPEKGGHTNFQNADVHVRPQVGSGIFFSYIDPATNLTDFGLTQHSGCPVYEGEKKIITQWVRKDVNSETTYEALNSLDVLISEGGE